MTAPTRNTARPDPRLGARHLSRQARLRADARAARRRRPAVGARRSWSRSTTPTPPPLRLPARDRRRPQELGRSQGPEPRSARQAPRHADRGPSPRVRRLRGHHPRGRVRRRHGPALGPRHLDARRRSGSGPARRAAEVHAAGREAPRRLDAGPAPRPRPARRGRPELAPHQGAGRGRATRRASSSITEARPESVVERTATRGASRSRAIETWHSNRAAKTPAARRPLRPDARPPEPARRRAAASRRPAAPAARRSSSRSWRRSSPAPPAGDEWLHEMKFDGYRILCRIDKGRGHAAGAATPGTGPRVPRGRRRRPAASRRARRSSTARSPCSCRTARRASRRSRTPARRATAGPARVLRLRSPPPRRAGSDRRAARGAEGARSSASSGARRDGAIRYSTHVVGQGEEFFRQACRLSLEGIVSKRRDAPYEPGRGRSWLKVKCIQEQEFVVGGFTEPKGTRDRPRRPAPRRPRRRAAGSSYVGQGRHRLHRRHRPRRLRARLDRLRVPHRPFERRPPGAPRRALGEARAGRRGRRSPSGRRTGGSAIPRSRDSARTSPRPTSSGSGPRPAPQPPRDGGRGAPKTAPATARPDVTARADDAVVAGVRISHPDRVVYPEDGVTKARAGPLLRGRRRAHPAPSSRRGPPRSCAVPDGLGRRVLLPEARRAPGRRASLRRVSIREKTKAGDYLVVEDVAGLVGLVQMGVLEIHTWNAQAERARGARPPRLRPRPRARCPLAGRASRRRGSSGRRLEAQGLESFVKTTGRQGPPRRRAHRPGPGWSACVAFAGDVAEALVAETPRAFTATMAKSARKGRDLHRLLPEPAGGDVRRRLLHAGARRRAGLDAGHVGGARRRPVRQPLHDRQPLERRLAKLDRRSRGPATARVAALATRSTAPARGGRRGSRPHAPPSRT